MPVNLKGRSFLTLKDFSSEEIRYLLDLAHDLKAKKRAGIKGNLLEGRNIVLLFEKPPPARAARLRSPHMTKAQTAHSFQTAKWAKRNRLRTRRRCWAASMTE